MSLERVLRGAALGLALFALWRSMARRDARSMLHVAFREAPLAQARDSLRALRQSGTTVTWSAGALEPLAVSAERQREPGAPVRIAVVASGPAELRDALGLLDTVRGAGVLLGVEPSGPVTASRGGVRGTVTVGAPPLLRPVLVVGRASWEAKFVVAALEEQGWSVHARFFVAPGADVTQGRSLAIDTANYSAVIVLDSSLGGASRRPGSLTRYVRTGGGLVLAAGAANAASVRGLAPGRSAARRAAATRDPAVGTPLDALPLFAIESMRNDAVRLATRGALVAMAARREGQGRVLQLGFDETWRWRMQGGDGALAAHRAWWSHAVGSVAFAPNDSLASRAAPTGALTPRSAAEGAPVARMIDALGAPTAEALSSVPSPRLPAWLLPALLATLFGEWASRRLRGAK